MHKTRESLDAQQEASLKIRAIPMGVPMAIASFNYTKTQTRRTAALHQINEAPGEWDYKGFKVPFKVNDKHTHFPATHAFLNAKTSQIQEIICPYGQVGDILYVKEKFKFSGETEDERVVIHYADGTIEYIDVDYDREDYWQEKSVKLLDKMAKKDAVIVDEENERYTWDVKNIPFTSGMFMPKDAARTWLVVTGIRIERLQDITEGDALKEGVLAHKNGGYFNYRNPAQHHSLPENCDTAKSSFYSLWESINGDKSLYSNPWVWVVSFERIKQPENIY